jgi:RNA polymerase sigma factor (sigma-70 family)
LDESGDDLLGFDDAYPRLYRQAYQGAFRILGERTEAEDVAQEALARCLCRWRRTAGYADAFVTRVAVNLAIDRYRRTRNEPVLPARAPAPAADAHVELRADLVRALRTLTPRQRDVVVLRYLFDLPLDWIV